MSIHINDSLTRKLQEFQPINPPQVNMYVCGPTVYDEPHIGHARSAYIFDVIRRYLKYKGYEVKFVRNVTDVDDKIIDKAKKEYPGEDLNISFKKVADKYLVAYHEALAKLDIEDKDIIEPKASEYIDKMIVFISNLIDKRVAYQANGDVYFDIKKSKNYGKLSGQSLDKMESGARVAPGENKRDPLDFALWKSAKEGEPSWESPFGKGRPGWHIECSVMSSDILGDEFDIHGGGIDLIFPHHENEIAQSEGAGKRFAKYWIHHGLLTINGQKMAKSLGNFVTVNDFIKKYKNADILKLIFLTAHYSHPIDFNEEKVAEARQALDRIVNLFDKIDRATQGVKVSSKEISQIRELRDKFIEVMNEDFNTPKGLACIFDLVNLANKNSSDMEFIYNAGKVLRELLDLLGISLNALSDIGALSDAEIEAKILERNQARRNKNFSLADQIRKYLESLGIILNDEKGEAGSTFWRRKV